MAEVEAALDHVENATLTSDQTPAAGVGHENVVAVMTNLPARRSYTLIENGLEFDPEVTYEEWERDVLGLIGVRRKIDWALADALAYGNDRWGEDASQVLDDTPFSTKTLWNMAWIARSIPMELRNDNLPFTTQAEVAVLPYADQKEILEAAAEENLDRTEVRTRVRKRKQKNAREAAEKLPVPSFVPPSIVMEVADATKLTYIPSESVNLLLTSPPYGIEDPARGEGMRKYRTSDDWRNWATLIDDFFWEAARILAPGGRMAVNVPFDTWVGGEGGGQRPTYWWVVECARKVGLTYVTTICWDEGTISKSVARGSVDSPSAPRVINRQEAIAVFCKGEYNRLQAMKDGGLTTDLTHDEWLEWTDGTWAVPGESNGWEGFSAAWPQEIARRLITLFSFKEDVVADPFAGSFTSALVAWRLGRAGYFSDIEPEQVASGKRRLATAAGTL